MPPRAKISPYYARLRAHCLAKPGAGLEHPWGEDAFKVNGKVFAISGPGSPLRVTLKAPPAEQAALCTHPAIERAAYVGRFGWVTVTVKSLRTLRLALDLIDASYRLVAPKRARPST